MEPDYLPAIGAAGRRRPAPPTTDPDLLPSRRTARASIRGAMARARGPVALTGEPGSGKTALWRGLEAERRAGESWLAVEAGPGLVPGGLYRLIALGLGLRTDGFGRPELHEALAARSLDGERWTLVLDEAQNLDAATIEEVRVLSNRLGQPEGFAAILLVGQTPLARWLAGNAGRPLASRLAGHVHLRALDADEVGLLLEAVAPGVDWSEDAVDHIHRETRGRPGLVADRAALAEPAPSDPDGPVAAPAPSRAAPLMGPARPPIRVEDGLIEVGWTPEPDPLPDHSKLEAAPLPPSAPVGRGEERIDDPYAALQAWREWATNQGRHPEIESSGPIPAASTSLDEPGPSGSSPRVWADTEHGFAPFGRLFTRLGQENEAE